MMLAVPEKHYTPIKTMISFSGIDCCGKSTQINLLCKEFEAKGIKHQVVWSRGGYTPGIEFLKKLLRGGKPLDKEARIAHSQAVHANSGKKKLLFTAALMDLWFYYTFVLRFKELLGTRIICDRYIWDTYIDFRMKYPEFDFEKGFWWRLTLKTMLKPNPSYVLFIPAEESMRRSGLKEEPFPEPIEVREQRIQMYLNEVEKGRWQHKIDATQSIEGVYEQIKSVLT